MANLTNCPFCPPVCPHTRAFINPPLSPCFQITLNKYFEEQILQLATLNNNEPSTTTAEAAEPSNRTNQPISIRAGAAQHQTHKQTTNHPHYSTNHITGLPCASVPSVPCQIQCQKSVSQRHISFAFLLFESWYRPVFKQTKVVFGILK